MLHEAWRSGRMHHAWLLTGPSGIGKATLARRFACVVLGAADRRRIVAASHPDLLVVARSAGEKRDRPRAEIVLDDVRPVAGFLHHTAACGGWRVVIVDGADHLNRNAANALLKSIEEPPPRAIMLLTCDAPARLPPTLRSRCRSLRLAPLDDAAMRTVLGDLLPALDAHDLQGLVELGRGSPGHALSLAQDDGVALAALAEETLVRHERLPAGRCYDIADRVLRHDNGFSTFLGLLSSVASRAARAGIRQAGDGSGQVPSSRSPAQWAETCERLARLREETERLNLDKRHALLTGLGLLSGS